MVRRRIDAWPVAGIPSSLQSRPARRDAAKAGKLGKRLKALEDAIQAAKIKLARHAADAIAGRKAAADKFLKKIKDAIAGCATYECKVGKFEHYKYTPVGGQGKGVWTAGSRGDGIFKPDPDSKLGQALKKFNEKTGKNLDSIPYKNGFPDFGDFVVSGKGKAQIEIIQTGDDAADFRAADNALRDATGYTESDLEYVLDMKLTWHHKEDGVTMQLVPQDLHGARSGSGHAGGSWLNNQEEF